jgi:repressor LexA
LIVAKTYITDISDYLNDIGLLKRDMPAPVNRMAEFLLAIIEAVTPNCPTVGHNTGVRCRKRGCKGLIHASLQVGDGKITWRCPLCEQNGGISNWQGTQWDLTAASKLVPTPKEGQYLAFIYYYTKIHRQNPSELDMLKHFRVTPPAVHDMVLRLETHGFISREPGVPRSIRLLLKREELPDLE